MTVASLFELGSMYLQFMNLAMSINVTWSPKWDVYINLLKLFSFDFHGLDFFFPSLHLNSLPINEPRIDFLSKAACIPLIISILMVFFYKSQPTLIWFLLFLCGISAALIGGVVASEIPSLNGNYILYAGVGTIGLMVLIYVGIEIYTLYITKDMKDNPEEYKNKNKTKKIEDVTDFNEISKDVQSLKKSKLKQTRMAILFLLALIFVVLFVVGLFNVFPNTFLYAGEGPYYYSNPYGYGSVYNYQNIKFGLKNVQFSSYGNYEPYPNRTQWTISEQDYNKNINSSTHAYYFSTNYGNVDYYYFKQSTGSNLFYRYLRNSSSFYNDYYVTFVICAVIIGPIGFLACCNCFGNCFKSGRTTFTKMNSFVRKSSLKVVLVLLALIYMPINTVLLKFTVCEPISCGAGQMISRVDGWTDISSILSTSVFPRNLSNTCTNCVVDNQCPATLIKSFCGGESDSLLVIDPTLSCSREIVPYFIPAVILMLISFTFGIPFLYYRLVKMVNIFLQKIKLLESNDDDWIIRIRASKNSCSQMYNVYFYKWRYFKLVLIWYRLLIVSFFVFLSTLQLNKEAMTAMITVHSMSLVVALYTYSYFQNSNQLVLFSTIIMNIAACSLVMKRINNSEISDDLAVPFSVSNILIPLIAFTLGFVWDLFDRSNIKKVDPTVVTKRQKFERFVKKWAILFLNWSLLKMKIFLRWSLQKINKFYYLAMVRIGRKQNIKVYPDTVETVKGNNQTNLKNATVKRTAEMKIKEDPNLNTKELETDDEFVRMIAYNTSTNDVVNSIDAPNILLTNPNALVVNPINSTSTAIAVGSASPNSLKPSNSALLTENKSISKSPSKTVIKEEETAAALLKVNRRLRKIVKDDREKIKLMDMVLDRKILKLTVNYFAFLGLVSTIALSLGIVGLLTQKSFNQISKDTRPNFSIDSLGYHIKEFGSFSSWKNFTSNCCCMISKSDKTNGIEYWRCQQREPTDFQYKVLNRQNYNSTNNVTGYYYRSFCSKTFINNADPIFNEDGSVRLGQSLNGSTSLAIMKRNNWNQQQYDASLFLW